jgi:hypothetical protein
MITTDQLRLAINDRINNDDINPSHVPLALLGEFQKDVSEFLKGSSNDVDYSKIMVSIESGSLAFLATGLLAAASLWSDIETLKTTRSLSLIDPKRANVIERWQYSAQKNPRRRYSVSDKSSLVFFSINSDSNFKLSEDIWVQVEKYLYGNITNMGGKNKANIHLDLENGEILPPISTTQNLLAQGEQNRLYRHSLVHISAEENLRTGKLRNLTLLSFEDHKPVYDEQEFKLMVERGTKAWSGVPVSWLEDLRGNNV